MVWGLQKVMNGTNLFILIQQQKVILLQVHELSKIEYDLIVNNLSNTWW